MLMLTKIRSRLWLQLSLVSCLLVAGVVGGAYDLVVDGLASVKAAFLMCFVALTLATAVILRAALAPLRGLADAADAMRDGELLTVRSTAPDEVGRLARALRGLQLSTHAAMSRMSGADGASFGGDTMSWPVVVIGPEKTPWARRVVSAVIATLATATISALVLVAVDQRPHAGEPQISPAAVASRPTKAAPSVLAALPRGVTRDSVTLGMSAPFSGGPRSLSEGMKLGLDTAFAEVNAAGGVHGRQLKLVALDNGYDEKRALETTKDLVERRGAFALIGSVGTPTVKAVLPYVNANKVLLFGPLTGSPVTRNDPPDRYVFNVRASYLRETSAMVDYLLDVRRLPARSIVVFAQNDSFGDAGYEGASMTIRKKVPGSAKPERVGYERNSTDVTDAVNRVLAYNTATAKSGGVRAVIVVATATASASFTAKIASLDAIILNVSFVDAGQLAQEFHDHWPGVGTGVIVTQVVPHFDSGATGVIRYRDALKAFAPDKSPGFASLEGYVVGSLFAEGLRRAGPDVDTERMIDALERVNVDMGTGGALSFGVSKHGASQKVWGTVLTANGTYKPLDAEWVE